jgi:proteasome lid subunit RPN8/RPN11
VREEPLTEVIDLAAEAIEAIVMHARESAPDECCGLLLGSGDRIADAMRSRNIDTHPQTRFLIDPHDHFAARRAARARGLEVVGFYHSHPRSAAAPSARDLAEFSYPGHLYAIVSLRAEPPEVGLFRFDDRNFQRVPFVRGA